MKSVPEERYLFFSVVALQETQVLRSRFYKRRVVTTQPNERTYDLYGLGLRDIFYTREFILHRVDATAVYLGAMETNFRIQELTFSKFSLKTCIS